ncbi:hypothetical protein NB537_00215 [Vibrio parahaemolyticus]|nr:hypothetical protein [Vibrio parahaemolyticus]MCR9653223.1 hypothetical protein [Vibrio parahaemolyticus]MDF5595837.1 hypothetical protein [Vibrio parahaemolyticus]
MEHYQHLILKGLINGGGSSSETYVYQLLTGNVSDQGSSVSHMWGYLDNPLKETLIEIFADICSLDLTNKTDRQIVPLLIDYMAEKAGRSEFFKVNDRREIERMSDDEYEGGIQDLIRAKKVKLLDRE